MMPKDEALSYVATTLAIVRSTQWKEALVSRNRTEIDVAEMAVVLSRKACQALDCGHLFDETFKLLTHNSPCPA